MNRIHYATKQLQTYQWNFTSKYSIHQPNYFKNQQENTYDVAIIGGGIIGSAIAREITNLRSDIRTVIIEKENGLGKHQSSHNSGVIHAGMYYKPNSLKAKLCVKGVDLILKYCNEKNIPYKGCGKLIVATNSLEKKVLKDLYERGVQNNLDLKVLKNVEDIKEIEPKCRGRQALWSPRTGNINWGLVTESFGRDFRENGGDISYNNEIIAIKASSDCVYPILLESKENSRFKTKYLIICGGLQSDLLSDLVEENMKKTSVIVSFLVDYKLLKNQSISTNIYGVPDMDLPFLGAHLSPTLDGSVLLGPTAIPAYTIDGYYNDELNFTYFTNTVTTSSFRNMITRYFSRCIDQAKKTLFPNFQTHELQKLACISDKDIEKGPSAVQAQLVNEDGTFVDDFVFECFEGDGIKKRIINCKFLPSPAATASMAVAEFVVEKLFQECSK